MELMRKLSSHTFLFFSVKSPELNSDVHQSVNKLHLWLKLVGTAAALLAASATQQAVNYFSIVVQPTNTAVVKRFS